jgi:hypothetical protein
LFLTEDDSMQLDIRVPIGLMFGVLGAMLAAYGMFFSDPAIYERSLGININIWWGLVLLAFGAGMYFFGRRANAMARPTDERPAGSKTEKRESRPRGH